MKYYCYSRGKDDDQAFQEKKYLYYNIEEDKFKYRDFEDGVEYECLTDGSLHKMIVINIPKMTKNKELDRFIRLFFKLIEIYTLDEDKRSQIQKELLQINEKIVPQNRDYIDVMYQLFVQAFNREDSAINEIRKQCETLEPTLNWDSFYTEKFTPLKESNEQLTITRSVIMISCFMLCGTALSYMSSLIIKDNKNTFYIELTFIHSMLCALAIASHLIGKENRTKELMQQFFSEQQIDNHLSVVTFNAVLPFLLGLNAHFISSIFCNSLITPTDTLGSLCTTLLKSCTYDRLDLSPEISSKIVVSVAFFIVALGLEWYNRCTKFNEMDV